MTDWTTTIHKKIKLNSSILIEGMPGIGNVGKIAADTIVSQLNAVKIATLFSPSLPNSVFVKENGLVELPRIEIYHKKIKKTDFLFLVGDVQPDESKDSYSFTHEVLNFAKKMKCKEIIALGGIGLSEEPIKSKVYVTGNDRKFVDSFEKFGADSKIYGIVGPIMGISGLLLGLARDYKIPSAALLAETFANPVHIGLNESKELMYILDKKYSLGLSVKKFEKDIKKYDDALKPLIKQNEIEEAHAIRKETSYIG